MLLQFVPNLLISVTFLHLKHKNNYLIKLSLFVNLANIMLYFIAAKANKCMPLGRDELRRQWQEAMNKYYSKFPINSFHFRVTKKYGLFENSN